MVLVDYQNMAQEISDLHALVQLSQFQDMGVGGALEICRLVVQNLPVTSVMECQV